MRRTKISTKLNSTAFIACLTLGLFSQLGTRCGVSAGFAPVRCGAVATRERERTPGLHLRLSRPSPTTSSSESVTRLFGAASLRLRLPSAAVPTGRESALLRLETRVRRAAQQPGVTVQGPAEKQATQTARDAFASGQAVGTSLLTSGGSWPASGYDWQENNPVLTLQRSL